MREQTHVFGRTARKQSRSQFLFFFCSTTNQSGNSGHGRCSEMCVTGCTCEQTDAKRVNAGQTHTQTYFQITIPSYPRKLRYCAFLDWMKGVGGRLQLGNHDSPMTLSSFGFHRALKNHPRWEIKTKKLKAREVVNGNLQSSQLYGKK